MTAPDDCSRIAHHFIDGECIYCLAPEPAPVRSYAEQAAHADYMRELRRQQQRADIFTSQEN